MFLFFLSVSLLLLYADSDFISRFLELASILDPGRPPKMDKAVLLADAARMVTQLRDEAQKLKDSNENLLEKINELKVGFNFIISCY